MTVTGLITAIVIGIIIGVLGRLVAPGKHNIPIWLTITVGMVAAILGTFLARPFGVDDRDGFNPLLLIIQVALAAAGVAAVASRYGKRGLRR
jgi:uncharacterized membrane protein YeaQ/YmgE (transglycosylase-associated protein family)